MWLWTYKYDSRLQYLLHDSAHTNFDFPFNSGSLFLFSGAMATAHPLKEDLQKSLFDRYGPIILRDFPFYVICLHSAYLPSLRNSSFSDWVNVKINFTFRICLQFLGSHLFPIHSYELDTVKIMCRVYLPSSSFAMCIFGQLVITNKHADKRSACLWSTYCVETFNCVYLTSSRRRLHNGSFRKFLLTVYIYDQTYVYFW